MGPPWAPFATTSSSMSSQAKPPPEGTPAEECTAAWRELARASLRGKPLDSLSTSHLDGFRLPPIGFPDDAPMDAGWPGFAPRRRGASAADGWVGWDLRSIHDAPTPETARSEILEDLRGGVSSIELRLAKREGGVGLLLRSVDDLDDALGGVDLGIAPIALDAGDAFREAAAVLLALWRRRGVDPRDRLGAFNADPLGEAARTGFLDPGGLERLAQLASVVAERSPGITCARADGSPYHDAGASDAQEVACTLATAVAYLGQLLEAGLPVIAALRQISLRCSLDGDYLTGLAKIRALRELWARIGEATLEHQGLAEDVPATRIEAIPGRRGLSRIDPWTNLLRVGSAMLGAALGGAQTLITLPASDALGIGSRSLARRLARNLQLLLAEEAHLHRVIDPAGGSWALETLTDRLADAAWESFQTIEAEGGMLVGLREGRVQRTIAETAARRKDRLARRREVLVGVNDFASAEDDAPMAPDPTAPPEREPADSAARHRSLDDLSEALGAGSTIELGPAPSPVALAQLPFERAAAPFERLRRETRERLGDERQVVLAKLGDPRDWSGRLAFSHALLAVAGLEGIEAEPCDRPEQLADALARAGGRADRAVIVCSSDARYADQGVVAVEALRAAGAGPVIVAGRPEALEADLRRAGAGQLLAAGADVLDQLAKLVDALDPGDGGGQRKVAT